MIKKLSQLIISSAFVASSSLLNNAPGRTQSMPVCPASGTVANLIATGACRGTPSRYEISIYEMGLCTSDPLGSGSFNRATCTRTFASGAGKAADLAGGASVSLGSSGSGGSSRPTNGTYTHAYIVIANTFGLRASYALAGGGLAGTYGSSSTGSAVNGGTPTNFTETLTSFNPGGPCTPTAWENVGSGRLDAVVADTSLSTATTCASVSRIIGSFAPTTPITITPSTTGIQVTFSVTNNGMTVIDGAGGVVDSFASGPFSPTFTILN